MATTRETPHKQFKYGGDCYAKNAILEFHTSLVKNAEKDIKVWTKI